MSLRRFGLTGRRSPRPGMAVIAAPNQVLNLSTCQAGDDHGVADFATRGTVEASPSWRTLHRGDDQSNGGVAKFSNPQST
jgi:hypothetical protein